MRTLILVGSVSSDVEKVFDAMRSAEFEEGCMSDKTAQPQVHSVKVIKVLKKESYHSYGTLFSEWKSIFFWLFCC